MISDLFDVGEGPGPVRLVNAATPFFANLRVGVVSDPTTRVCPPIRRNTPAGKYFFPAVSFFPLGDFRIVKIASEVCPSSSAEMAQPRVRNTGKIERKSEHVHGDNHSMAIG